MIGEDAEVGLLIFDVKLRPAQTNSSSSDIPMAVVLGGKAAR
jgi:hypothetical protein